MLDRTGLDLRGDTIIEVLLAIAIASFAIGITYATAQRSLNQSITAREHAEALNIMQNQLTDLRLRYQTDPSGFEATYGSPNNHFCLTDAAIFQNNGKGGPPSQSAPLTLKPTGPYDQNCTSQRAGDGVVYYIDIQTAQLGSPIIENPTVYQVFVRWGALGGNPTNQTSLFYRVNGATTQTLGYALPFSLDKLYPYRGTTNAS